MSDDQLTPEIRRRLQPGIDPEALRRFLLALPQSERNETLRRFLLPEPLDGAREGSRSRPSDQPPPPERPIAVVFGMKPRTMRYSNPELQRLYEAIFVPRRSGGGHDQMDE